MGASATETAAPTWLVVEPYFDGHHYTYLEHIVAGLQARGTRVIVGVGDDAAQGRRTRTALDRRFGGTVQVVIASLPQPSRARPAALRLLVDEVRRRHFLRRVLAEATRIARVDHVFLPYFDWALFAMALLGSPFGRVPYSGITMRQRFHLRACGVTATPEPLQGVKARLFHRLLRSPTLARVFSNDETLAEHFQRSAAQGARKVVHIPDPSDPRPLPARDAARAALGLSASGCVVLLYGFLDARKGVAALVDWLAGPAAALDVTLLAVGQQDAEVSACFADPAIHALIEAGRIRVVRDFIPEEDEPAYFAAADLVWLGYERFEMMSGVLVKAAQYGRAVIFRNYGLVAHYAGKHGEPHAPSGECARVAASLPPELHVRDFSAPAALTRLPDHSWSNAIRLIHQ